MTTPARSLELSDTISALVTQQPFFAVLLFELLDFSEGDSLGGTPVKTAATNGRQLVINPEFFKQISVQERMGVLAHEILHVILEHPARGRAYVDRGLGPDLKPFNWKKANYAQDYIINQMVVESGLHMPLGALFNPQVKSSDIWDEVYTKIPDPPEDDDDSGRGQHLPSEDASQAPDKPTIQRAMKMAAGMAKSQGTVPAGLLRLVDEICEPKVKWTDYVQRTIQNIIGNEEYTWARPNRRRMASPPHIYWPGRSGSRSGVGVIEVDTSGSIGEDELKQWFGEIHGIMSEVQPEKLYVGFVDAQLHNDELHELEDVNDLTTIMDKCGGGGGTDMTVIFREIEKRGLEPEFVIILTDGYTGFGEDCGRPTIWCITTPGITAPWGMTVHCPLNG